MKLTRKQKLVRTLVFFLDFSSAHFDHCKQKQAAYAPGDYGDYGTNVSDEIDQKTKVVQKTCFFLRFFSPAHFDQWKLRQAACAPGDHGDHGTSVSDEIDQKRKVDQNTWFFLRFFPPPHFGHWKLRQELLKLSWVGGQFDYSVSPGPSF